MPRFSIPGMWLKLSAIGVGIIIVIAIFSAAFPKNQEPFIAMGLLGKYGRADNYYPNNSSTITVGTQVQWRLYIYNHMSDTKNISIRVKLLNATQPGPNDQNKTSSPATAFMTIPLTLLTNETRILPFTFNITGIVLGDSFLRVASIDVNHHPYSVNVIQQMGTRLRFLFELWSIDSANKPIFSWKSADTQQTVWNQMWFNVTSS